MYAAIDIGSNTVQLLICEVADGRLRNCINDLHTTRLGAMAAPGVLAKPAIQATAEVIAAYMARIRATGVSHCRMLATSAARDAKNSDALKWAIYSLSPDAPQMEILSGSEEAALSYRGAAASLDFPPEMPVFDAGGASSELIYLQQGKILGISADVGAVRAAQNRWERREIKDRLTAAYGSPRFTPAMVGVGGTITALAGWKLALPSYQRNAIEGETLSRTDMEAMLTQLMPLTPVERSQVSPLLAKRGEIIVEGLWIWLSAMEILHAEQVLVTGGGILDGAVAEMAACYGEKKNRD